MTQRQTLAQLRKIFVDNNIIETIQKADLISLIETGKIDDEPKKRRTIPMVIREDVWLRYAGNKMTAKCPICDGKIKFTGFDCGHKIAFAKGGKETIDNLIPLCAMCNRSMGDQDYDTFRAEVRTVLGRALVRRKWWKFWKN